MVPWYAIPVTTAVLYFLPIKYFASLFFDQIDSRPIKFNKKTAIVFLNTIGMNYEKARDYARYGSKVILASNNKIRAEMAKKELTATTKNKNICFIWVDNSNSESLRSFAKYIAETCKSVDILVNNDGFELTELGINFSKQELALERFTNHCLHFLRNNDKKTVKNQTGKSYNSLLTAEL